MVNKTRILLVAAPSFYRAATGEAETPASPGQSSRFGDVLMGDQDHEPTHAIFYLKSFIESHSNLEVRTLDLNIEHYVAARNGQTLDQFKILASSIDAFEPDLVGISSMRPNLSEARIVASQVRSHAPSIEIVLGGPCTSDHHIHNLPEFDYVEPSQTMLVAAKNLIDRASRGAANLVANKPHYMPDYSDLGEMPDVIPRFFHSVGCGAGCDFCYPAAIRNFKIESRADQTLATQIINQVGRMQPDFWLFGDLTLHLASPQVQAILSDLANQPIPPWWCQTQARYLNKSTSAKLANAGCRQVAFAVEDLETHNTAIRRKNAGLEQTVASLDALAEHGISRQLYWCFGLPDDTHDAAANRVEDIRFLIERNLVDSIHLSYFMPYPGTPYGDRPADYGITLERSFEQHYADAQSDFYNPLPMHSVAGLTSMEIKQYFDNARQLSRSLKPSLIGNT